ncbi:hypothetical protein [Amorphus sp. MBR-141]
MSARKLRIFGFDPSLARSLSTRTIHEVLAVIPDGMETVDVDEPFLGPVGEYVSVIDIDPASGLVYPPIDLNDSTLLAQDGLSPDERDPKFHQQMVYAVAMTTIANFEEALGRVALWSPRIAEESEKSRYEYVGQLRIYPHALREANAYYSPTKKALLFGYFQADSDHPNVVPGATIFTCLSHDVVAHETTHALLDGLHRRYAEATNPDALAFHEAFADIVALFQHFSYPDVLRDQVARTRGDLGAESLLGQLAQEFGQALGRGAALRSAIGAFDEDGRWQRLPPDRTALARTLSPHSRGAILVAAVFDAFLNIYQNRTADLIRIATNGSGILPPGAIHPDLVERLQRTASETAQTILQMCIRALDYLPPVDITFGDYLRAILTADNDLFADATVDHRVGVLEAFLKWGIYPKGRRSYSVESLLWPKLSEAARDQDELDFVELTDDFTLLDGTFQQVIDIVKRRRGRFRGAAFLLDERAKAIVSTMETRARERPARYEQINEKLKRAGRSTTEEPREFGMSVADLLSRKPMELGLAANRQLQYELQDFYGLLFWTLLTSPAPDVVVADNEVAGEEAYRHASLLKAIGLVISPDAPPTVARSRALGGPSISLQSVRMASRRGVRGQTELEFVVEILQRRKGFLDPIRQNEEDAKLPEKVGKEDFWFRRGCTLLIDARTYRVRRVIQSRGNIADNEALDRTRTYIAGVRERRQSSFFEGEFADLSAEKAFAHLHRYVEEA